ncbi:NADH dehydrogenase [ubiquinone] 1 beta subcomplex subunit 11, mitochondrial [Colletes gigas]|uniref:NADH dehydrogenase [ubiquinone] 1 beta subcomplex subunit 11, mitochondrial n=1 Tax=Colletes gigas TaxID=935657 RepID=UPI001C9B7EE1|nr:NADH dehydrogenase [ubiquinone] 1 beta subcomplex subunit 11, mitochondrial [Colletes gigas]
MSMLVRLVRSQGIRNKFPLLTSKDVKVLDTVLRHASATPSKIDVVSDKPFPVKKKWVSYGFDEEDEKMDRHWMHQTLFVAVTVCCVFGIFVCGYLPDPKLKSWAQREAYFQIRLREEKGLPLIDPNFVDPSKFTLPTDEELGETEIII